MKKNIVLIILACICFCACKHKSEDVITDAKKKAAGINSDLKSYKSKHVDDLTSTDPGSITGYYKDDEVKKVYAEHFGQKSRTFTEYYFDDGMLICVQAQDYIYNKPNTYTEEEAKKNNDSIWYDDKKTKLESSSFYFINNKMIKWFDAGKEIPVSDTNFAAMESETWARALILMKELKEEQ